MAEVERISLTEAAQISGLEREHIRRLAQQGRIERARLVGANEPAGQAGDWQVPRSWAMGLSPAPAESRVRAILEADLDRPLAHVAAEAGCDWQLVWDTRKTMEAGH